MALHFRKLGSLLSSTYKSRVFLVSRPVSKFLDTPRQFSTSQALFHPTTISQKPEEEFVKTNYEDFLEWHKGGGMFHKSALIDPTAFIEINALIHPEAVVGPDVHVRAGAVIGPGVRVGESTKIGYRVSLTNCTVGEFCIIHNGVCIGQDGFGFFVNKEGEMVKKPQNLKVRIGNHVEIGAVTCIDRGSWRDTVIGDHTKIDNLVQIGHNVMIGEKCMLCGQVGIAGSVTIGDYVTLAGRVAVKDHVSIVSNVTLAAMSCVTKDITEPGVYAGFPAVPIHEWRRQVVALRKTSKSGGFGNTTQNEVCNELDVSKDYLGNTTAARRWRQ